MRSQRERIAPLALILLFSFLALPFILYFVPNAWWRGDFDYEPPRRIVEWVSGGEESGAGPTEGMTVGPDGFGTVTEAPAILARKAPEGAPDGFRPENPIAPDVARFIRTVPRERLLNAPKDGMRVCDAEGPPHYQGRLVLVNGCLRFEDEGSAEPGPLVLGIPSVHRDAGNYLAVGLRDAAPEYELRVGESGGVFIGVGCSMDDPVPAPPELARMCDVSEMRRIGTIKRERLCTDAELEELARMRGEFEATQARLAAEHDSCVAQGITANACPPPVAPPPMNLYYPGCRIPDAAQPSHGSSTQP